MTRRGGLLAGLAVCILSAAALLYILLPRGESQAIRIGSKIFPESYILAEITAQMLEDQGIEVQRKLGLGGTLIAFEALQWEIGSDTLLFQSLEYLLLSFISSVYSKPSSFLLMEVILIGLGVCRHSLVFGC